MLGKNKIDEIIERIINNLGNVVFIIKFLKIIIPNRVNVPDISARKDRKYWSNPKISISNQANPCPGPGIDLKTKIIKALPIIVFLFSVDKSFIKKLIKVDIKIKEVIKIISWEKGIFDKPKNKVNKTKTILPIKIL